MCFNFVMSATTFCKGWDVPDDGVVANNRVNISLSGFKTNSMASDVSCTGLTLWFGASNICQWIVDNHYKLNGKKIVELGAGLGMVSIVASNFVGSTAPSITLTDGDSSAVEIAKQNVENNGCSEQVTCSKLWWGHGDELNTLLSSLTDERGQGADIVFAADVIYEGTADAVGPLMDTVSELLPFEADFPKKQKLFVIGISRRSVCFDELERLAHMAGFTLHVPDDYVWDIFGNQTEGMTGFWQNAIYVFERTSANGDEKDFVSIGSKLEAASAEDEDDGMLF